MPVSRFFPLVLLLWPAPAASAGIEMIKGLRCEGDGEAFTILFDHDSGEATLSTGAVTTLYRYEQGEKFLTWRLTDDAGRPRYTIREGDAVNGELGWYFSATKSVDENVDLTTGGTCQPVR